MAVKPDDLHSAYFILFQAERRLEVGFAASPHPKRVANRISTLSASHAACEISRLGLEFPLRPASGFIGNYAGRAAAMESMRKRFTVPSKSKSTSSPTFLFINAWATGVR